MLTASFAYLLASPTLATLHIAAVYYREHAAKRRRVREVLELELLLAVEAKEPEGRSPERRGCEHATTHLLHI